MELHISWMSCRSDYRYIIMKILICNKNLILTISGGAPMVYFNLTNRLSPQNMSIGKTPQTTFIKVDNEFAKVNHYGIDVSLATIEVSL